MHIDIVGPLPPSNGQMYLLTCVDRFTRWPVAIPIPDITAETIARAFITHWIAQFGVPSSVTTDRGRQFESSLYRALTNLLGCKSIRTASYHPASNGLVERFHRQFNASLSAHSSQRWTETLPLVSLGIRTAVESDLGCSVAEMVFGTTIRLPGGFIVSSGAAADLDTPNYVQHLRHDIHDIMQPANSRTRNSS